MRPTFYRRLWRFNALVIAAAGILSAFAAVGVLVMVASDLSRRSTIASQDRENHRKVSQTRDMPVLKDGQRVRGTPFVAITLGSAQALKRTGISSDFDLMDQDDRNVLLVDFRDGSSRHVLPDNSRELVQWHVLPDDEKSDQPVRAYVALVRSGSAGDTPRYDVLVGDFVSGRQMWAARSISAMDTPELVDDAVGFLAWNGSRATYLRVGLGTMARQTVRDVPILK